MFDRALALVLAYEGGYANNPADPGGATNKGVTQATYDNHRRNSGLPWQSVRKITDEEVALIYKRNYWQDGGCSLLASYQPYLAIAHFDFCVNAGIRQATKILQRCVGAKDDGLFGPKTFQATIELDEFSTIETYVELRNRFYRQLVKNRPASLEFLRGWLIRTAKLEGTLYEYRAKDTH